MDKIARLYQCYENLLLAGKKINEQAKEYMEILNAADGTNEEKFFASQYLCTFFGHFPFLADAVVDAQLKLCKNENTKIRQQAIKNLPKFCNGSREITFKIAHALAKQLVLVNPAELQQVHNSLCTLIRLNAKETLAGIFHQIAEDDVQLKTRELCLKFIDTKLFAMGATVITEDLESFLCDEVKKLVQNASVEEFGICMGILGSTGLPRTIMGQSKMVNLAMVQAQLNEPQDCLWITDEKKDCLIQCANAVMSYFSKSVPTTLFVTYICDNLLPVTHWKIINPTEKQAEIQSRLLILLAELSANCGMLENGAERIGNVYKLLLEYIPLLQVINTDDLGFAYNFPHIENLLYVLHTLAKRQPGALTFIAHADQLRDFRKRLYYLASSTQLAIKNMEAAQQSLHMTVALKAVKNIKLLIGDLIKAPAIFKLNIQLSWMMAKTMQRANKRHARIVFRDDTDAVPGNETKKFKPIKNQMANGTEKAAARTQQGRRQRGGRIGGIRRGGVYANLRSSVQSRLGCKK